MKIIGIIFLAIGVILFFIQRGQKQKLFSIKSARTITAAELQETAGAVAAEIGGGSWRDYVKLWGRVTIEQPLYSDQKEAPCVHFVSKVTREYETKDDEGKVQQKSEQVSQNRQSIAFWLHDRTGKIKVNPDGAEIETIEILNEFRPQRSGKTRGYRHTESVLPIDLEVLVVGAVSDLTGDVIIGKPVKSDHHYLISLKDEEMLTSATARSAKNIFYSMIGCFAIGIVLLIGGLLS
ncbi:MAG: E3 ubiquitin ligase family protein [Cyanobacteria bacterium J06607_6]